MFDLISGQKGFQVHTVPISAFKQNQHSQTQIQSGTHIKTPFSIHHTRHTYYRAVSHSFRLDFDTALLTSLPSALQKDKDGFRNYAGFRNQGFRNCSSDSENKRGIQKLFCGIQKLFRRIQKLLVVFRNYFVVFRNYFVVFRNYSQYSETISWYSETISWYSETTRGIQKLFVVFRNYCRRIQKLLVVFRNYFRSIQKLFRRIQKLLVVFRNYFCSIQKLFSSDSMLTLWFLPAMIMVSQQLFKTATPPLANTMHRILT